MEKAGADIDYSNLSLFGMFNFVVWISVYNILSVNPQVELIEPLDY